MLRRNSSKRVDRHKSTSSIHSKPDSMDPEVARHHAHTAATLAFNRAHDRSSADGSHNRGGVLRDSKNNHHDNRGSQHASDTQSEQVLRRQHSVRFVGANGGVQRRQSIGTRAVNNPVPPKPSTATLRPVAMTTNAPVPAAYRPPSRSSSIGKASGRLGKAESFVTAEAFDEYYTREEELNSTPSSYRRIRRSKSMYSPREAPNVYYNNGTPNRPESSYNGARTPFSNFSSSQTPQIEPTGSALRGPKSMSFLRGMQGQNTQERNDSAVQMARDRFFQETTQQRLRAQPSFIFRSNSRKQEKPFRKSVRSSSINSIGAVSSVQPQPTKESGLRDAARKASKTIKNKLKRVFGRGKAEPVMIPNQQLEAKVTHVRKYNGDTSTTHEPFSDIPHPDQASLNRVASRAPSIRAVPSNQQLRSQAGSVKSFKSEHSDDKSRVTSWQSTGANTIATVAAKMQTEKDQQRLSIINEHGTHIPSNSFSRRRLTNQPSAYPMVHRPSKSAGYIPASLPVDSARVYSALMKRLDENSPKAKLEASRKASFDQGSSPNRGSSAHNSWGNLSPATIRQVMPSETTDGSESSSSRHTHQWVRADEIHSARTEDIFGYAGTRIHQWQPADPLRGARMTSGDDVFSPYEDNYSDKENIPPGGRKNRRHSATPALRVTREDSTRTSFHTVPEEYFTPQEIAIQNEPIVQSKALRETKSTFFGGGTVTIQRTQSPFRRAMAEIDYNPTGMTNYESLPTQQPLVKNPLYQVQGTPRSLEVPVNRREQTYTESVYSTTTNGQGPAESQVSLQLPKEPVPQMPTLPTNTGDVVIINQTTYRPTMLIGSINHRATDSSGSAEWKRWMSSEVAKLERAKENIWTPSYVNYALPTMPKSYGHVRESAQISDDDVEVSQRKVSVAMQPLGLVQQQNPNIQNQPFLKPILKNRSTVSLVQHVEPVVYPNCTPVTPIPPAPPMPPISPLRSAQSKLPLKSAGTARTPNPANAVSSLSAHNLLHKRNVSQATLRSVKSVNASIKSVETPAKLVKRNRRPSAATNPSLGGGLVVQIDREFGSTSTNSRYKIPGSERENVKFSSEEDPYGIEGTGLLGPRTSTTDADAQVMGSKQMVAMFLSSRRKRIVSPSEGEGAGVFL